MRILLIRHGPPEFDYKRTVERAEIQSVLAEYSESVVTKRPRHKIPALGAASQIAVCSELARARSSAALLGFKAVTTSRLLNESLLPHPDVLPFRLSWRHLLLLFRIAWLLGYQRNAPGIRADRSQAREAAGMLVCLAQKHSEVVVFGHGVMNRLITNHLKVNGWKTDNIFGSGYWSYCVVSHE